MCIHVLIIQGFKQGFREIDPIMVLEKYSKNTEHSFLFFYLTISLFFSDYVWNVDIQAKGLGATRTIPGLHRLCLSDRTIRLFPVVLDPKLTSECEPLIFPVR